MVSSLLNRLALVVLLGAMTIPAISGNLRGLTHVLVCEQAVESPFLVQIQPGGEAIVASATAFGTDEELCGGLTVDLTAQIEGTRLSLDVILTNVSDSPWAGTVGLDIDTPDIEVVIPTSVGRVPAGESSASRLELELGEGVTDIAGTLLLGP